MRDLKSISNESISDLVDGRLPEDECARVVRELLSDSEAQKTWYAYHVVGDVLRSAELAPSMRDLAFLERLEQRMADEPTRPRAVGEASDAVGIRVQQSANAAVFRWKMLAGMACTALVGVVGLSLWAQIGHRNDLQMARQAPAVPATVTAETGAGPMLRDARLDELMAAHRQLGGHSALQVPAGFLRNATYEGVAR